jgi:hypothetical protein
MLDEYLAAELYDCEIGCVYGPVKNSWECESATEHGCPTSCDHVRYTFECLYKEIGKLDYGWELYNIYQENQYNCRIFKELGRTVANVVFANSPEDAIALALLTILVGDMSYIYRNYREDK